MAKRKAEPNLRVEVVCEPAEDSQERLRRVVDILLRPERKRSAKLSREVGDVPK